MGGRGSSSSGNRSENLILNTSPTVRVSYKDYKNYLNRGSAVEGSYDAGTKTIEVNVGRGVHALMNVMPDSYVKESGKPKLKAAVDLYNDLSVGSVSLGGNAPLWAKKSVDIVNTSKRMENEYGINHSKDLSTYFALKKRKKR